MIQVPQRSVCPKHTDEVELQPGPPARGICISQSEQVRQVQGVKQGDTTTCSQGIAKAATKFVCLQNLEGCP